MRKRYNKKKLDVKKTKKSGSSTQESERAEKALAMYKFLFWLDNFIYIREGRSNINSDGLNSEDEEEDDDDDDRTGRTNLADNFSESESVNEEAGISETSHSSSLASPIFHYIKRLNH